jgi:hypothetical protein
MSGPRVVCYTLGLASVLLNVVLLSGVSRSGTQDHVSSAAEPDSGWTAELSEPRPMGTSPPLAACAAQLTRLERAASEKSAQLRRSLPLPRLFRLGQPNPDGAARLGPLVDRMLLAVDGGVPPEHSLECRDVVCRLVLVAHADVDINPWTMALQRRDSDLQALTNGMSFHAGSPTQDALTKEGLVESTVYFRLAGNPSGSTPAR